MRRHTQRHWPSDDPSFEPGEDWFWNYETEDYAFGPALAPPEHHPIDQPTPGPAGRVPADWEQHLH
jgi:hypothetical protein